MLMQKPWTDSSTSLRVLIQYSNPGIAYASDILRFPRDLFWPCIQLRLIGVVYTVDIVIVLRGILCGMSVHS